jgi:peptidoglycan/LPS O-acetylase OafA/YrhL
MISLPFATLLLFLSFIAASLIANNKVQLPNYPIISGIWNWYIFLSFISVSTVLFGKINLYPSIQKALKISGNISYSAYLYHNLIIAILVMLCLQLSFTKEIQVATVLIGAIIGTYFIANISFNLIEMKGIHIGKQLCAYLKRLKT